MSMLMRIHPGRRWSSGRLLFAGFGGLLTLMGFAGVDALMVLRQAKSSNSVLRSLFLRRSNLLNQIRSGVYVSGTLARDYLQATDSGAAGPRTKLQRTERETDVALENYARSLSTEEAEAFRSLLAEVHTYWKMLNLMLDPDRLAERRRSSRYFYNQLVLRRQAMLDLADRIARRNEEEIAAGESGLGAMFDRLRFRLAVILTFTLAGGLGLAWITSARLLRAQKALEELSARLVSAQEEERRSISRELHDEVGQSLTALAMEAGAASSSACGTPEMQRRLQSIQRLAESSMNTVRNLALLLRPSMLDDLGLVPALRWQAREVSKRTGIKVKVVADDISSDFADEHNTCIYRVVQEALNNSVRHSHARSITVHVSGQDSKVRLSIEDDGDGFDTRRAPGLGLTGIAERVRNAGGVLQIKSEHGRGTILNIMLPSNGYK